MRKNAAAVLIGAFICLTLAMPVAAQANAVQDGMFQGLYEAITTWFSAYWGEEDGLPPQEMETNAHPGDSPELGPIIWPGGLRTAGDSPDLGQIIFPGGDSATGDSPELTPMIIPGG